MLLYAIRHGDPVYGPEERLTEKGCMQAKALADRLAVHGLDRIYSSPLRRARETAAPTAERLGLNVEIEPWCSEDPTWRDFSYKENGSDGWIMFQQNTHFRTQENIVRGNADWTKCKCLEKVAAPFEQGYGRIIAESDKFLEKLGYRRENGMYRILRANEERVALFCHQGFLTVWTPFLLGIPPHLFWSSFNVTHTGICVFNFADNPDGWTAPRCLAWSDTSHLFGAGLELKFNNRIEL